MRQLKRFKAEEFVLSRGCDVKKLNRKQDAERARRTMQI